MEDLEELYSPLGVQVGADNSHLEEVGTVKEGLV